MGDGKAINVIEYLDNLIEKGKASKGAIVPLKVSFAKVVKTIDGDTWQDTEVKSIDVEDYMARFANLTIGKYAPESLTVYKSRVNKAVGWYLRFLTNPVGHLMCKDVIVPLNLKPNRSRLMHHGKIQRNFISDAE